MNIGIRLHDVAGKGLEAKLAAAQRLGFTCVHLAMSKVIDGFVMADSPALLTERLAGEVRTLLDRYGLSVAVLGCYLNLATPDEAALRTAQEAYAAHLTFARWIGAAVVGTETGAPNADYRTTPECFTEEALALFITRLLPVLEAAEVAGVPLAIEPVCRHIVSTPQRARQVLEAVQSARCRIILDPVNLLNLENVDRQETVFGEALDLLGDAIDVVHWKDYRIQADGLTAVAAGHGLVRADSVLRWLAERPGLPVTLENTTPETVSVARDHVAARLCEARRRALTGFVDDPH